MKKSLYRSCSAVTLALACAALSGERRMGDVPRAISYQGYLADDAGQPLTGPVSITFRLFAQPGEGTEEWSEIHPTVQLDEGRFTVGLGTTTALPGDFSQPMFLEIEVGGETLSPRLPLRAVPYALQAANVDAAAIDTAALAGQAVTKAKLGNDIAGAGLAQNGDGSIRIAAGAVTGTMIADGTITDQNVAAAAEIAATKIAGTAVTLDGTATLTNKTLTNPVLQVRDTDFTIVDSGDPAYSVQLELSSPITPDRVGSPSHVLTIPDADGTLALESYVDAEIAGLATVAGSGQYADLLGKPGLQAVATTGSFADLTGLPGIFAHVAVIPGDGTPAPADLDATGTDDTLTLEGTGPISLGTDASRATPAHITVGLRLNAGLVVDESQQLNVGVDDATIGVNGDNLLAILNVPASKVTGLATVATSGDYTDLTNRPTLATIATSGSFADLGDIPALAELDTANTFTAPGAISLEPADASPDTVLLQVLGGGQRPAFVTPLFSIDSEGDVIANSFTGDGTGLVQLNAAALTSGTISLSVLPTIPTTKLSGLADIATSGSVSDLVDLPAFARLDLENTFTAAARAITFQPTSPTADAVVLQLIGPTRRGFPFFLLDAEGDVTATSFTGNGAGLTSLNAGNIASGMISLDRVPLIPRTQLADSAVDGTVIEDSSITNDDVADGAAIAFSKLGILSGDIDNNLLANDSFSLTVGSNLAATNTSVALGGTLGLSIDTTALAGNIAGWGLMGAGATLAVNTTDVTPAMASALPGKGLMHDTFDDTIAVNLGTGLKLDGGGKLVPDVDNDTIEVTAGGQLAVKSVDAVPVALANVEPPTPKTGALIFKDGVLQVYSGTEWIKVGTYQ